MTNTRRRVATLVVAGLAAMAGAFAVSTTFADEAHALNVTEVNITIND